MSEDPEIVSVTNPGGYNVLNRDEDPEIVSVRLEGARDAIDFAKKMVAFAKDNLDTGIGRAVQLELGALASNPQDDYPIVDDAPVIAHQEM